MPLVAPVIPPVIAPIVQVKVLGIFDVKVILGLVPLHVDAVETFVTIGLGLTVTVMVYGAPMQPVAIALGVTM